MKVQPSIIPTLIIFLVGITFYATTLNTHCSDETNRECNDRIESFKTIFGIVTIIGIIGILCAFVNGYYNSKEENNHIESKAPITKYQESDTE